MKHPPEESVSSELELCRLSRLCSPQESDVAILQSSIRLIHSRKEAVKRRMSEQQAKPKVLVADDERVIADTLAIILNQSRF